MKLSKITLIISGCVVLMLGLIWMVDFDNDAPLPDGADEPASSIPLTDSLTYDAHSGLVDGEGLSLILTNCSACHSTDLVKNNRFTRDGWLAKIRWMQKEQNLWDLGENEAAILDYLEKYYSPTTTAARAHLRREPLSNIQWYVY